LVKGQETSASEVVRGVDQVKKYSIIFFQLQYEYIEIFQLYKEQICQTLLTFGRKANHSLQKPMAKFQN